MNRNSNPYSKGILFVFFSTIYLTIIFFDAHAFQNDSYGSSSNDTLGRPIIFYQDTIWYVNQSLGPFSAADRADRINETLENLLESGQFDTASLSIEQNEYNLEIYHGQLLLGSISKMDVEGDSLKEEALAEQYLTLLKASYKKNNEEYSLGKKLVRTGLLAGLFLLVIFLLFLLNKGLNGLIILLLRKSKPYLKGFQVRGYEVLSSHREQRLLQLFLRWTKVALIAFSFYLSLPIFFSIFPDTRGVSNTLLSYLLNPITSFFDSFLSYIPELMIILIVGVFTFYILRLINFFSSEIENGKLTIPGFYSDWARPTFNLFKIIAITFSFILIFPYLPGSDSPAFQGVSVFLGLLISLGSSSAISNIIAGLVIIYMRAFKLGDRVTIGDTTGEVIEKTMLVTRIKTVKNEEVTIPNSTILAGKTINYSGEREGDGLILHTTVTIGYDAPWRKVHELLIAAANATELVKSEPRPFVLQTALNDFYVSYQLNAYTNHPGKSGQIYSNLHANIQDKFNEAGIEIMSPHYRANRESSGTTIPANYLPTEE